MSIHYTLNVRLCKALHVIYFVFINTNKKGTKSTHFCVNWSEFVDSAFET